MKVQAKIKTINLPPFRNSLLSRISFIFICSFLFFFSCPGQGNHLNAAETNLRFERFSLDEGLSQGRITAILQDKKGFLWLGTGRGLVKYDGYSFQTYEREPGNDASLSANNINCLCEDKTGILWIGTGNGLNRFHADTESFSNYMNIPGDSSSLSHNETWCIYPGTSGTWIGTGNGLNKFLPGSRTFVRYFYEPQKTDNRIFALQEDRSGMLWVGTNTGLYKFDPAAKIFTRSSMVEKTVWAIHRDKSGNLWIGSGVGLIRFDPRTGNFKRYSHNENDPSGLSSNLVHSVMESSKGEIWLGTNRGVNRFDPAAGIFTHFSYSPQNPHSLSSDLTLSIYEDHSGVIWIGVLDKGLNKLNPGSAAFIHYSHNPQDPNSLSSSLVSSIYQDRQGMLWIGTYGKGLNKFDPVKKKFTHYFFNKKRFDSNADDITAVYGNSRGLLWLGAYGRGIFAFDPIKETHKNYTHDPAQLASLSDDAVRCIYCDRRGFTWIGTDEGGLNRFDPRTQTFTHYRYDAADPRSLSSDSISTIYEDHNGLLWLGSENGLNKFDPDGGKSRRYFPSRNRRNPGANVIKTIHEDRTGILWIGALSGLFRFDPTAKKFKMYTKKDGLPSNEISGILADETGCLWISTTVGLAKFDPRTGRFKNFTSRDGLQHDDFDPGAFYKCRSGQLCFGGINGFNIFSPGDIKDNPHPPAVAITAFKKFNKKIDLGKSITELKEIRLSYRDYYFSFEFAALDFQAPEKNCYAYKMLGFDKEWIPTDAKNPAATYTNLPPGRYIFRVKACNNSGVWNQKGASIAVIIIPPFWKTWWFTIFAVLLFALTSYIIIHFSRKYFTLIAFWKKRVFIGHYKIIDEIGMGGMGTVYKARDIMDASKTAAVKVIREEFTQDPVRRKRFLMEAAIIDRLDHPNIVRIIERGEHDNRLFIAMEYLQGQSLRERITKNLKLPVKDARTIMLQLLDVIAKLHQEGIVHRDLKPENIMLLQQGRSKNFVKLLDFGLAKTEGITQLTESGTILGTIGYLAPEILSGERFSFAGDVYALGIIFYEMITGQKPFLGDTTLDVMKQILEKDPLEPQSLCSDISPQLNGLIMMMLAKAPAARLTAEQILKKLKRTGN